MSYRGRLEREIRELALNPSPGVSAWISCDSNSSSNSSSSSSSSSNNNNNSSSSSSSSSSSITGGTFDYCELIANAICQDGSLQLGAQIEGPEDSPFEGGIFRLSVTLSAKYPIEPPRALFTTPVHHPNIDRDGRICLDLLKPQPQGGWSPTININTLLLSIRLLLGNPNASDGLVPDVTEQYKTNREAWVKTAREMTLLHARDQLTSGAKRTIGESNSSSSSNSNDNENNKNSFTTATNSNQNSNANSSSDYLDVGNINDKDCERVETDFSHHSSSQTSKGTSNNDSSGGRDRLSKINDSDREEELEVGCEDEDDVDEEEDGEDPTVTYLSNSEDSCNDSNLQLTNKKPRNS